METLSCKICFQQFSSSAVLPVVFPCGHTLCRPCAACLFSVHGKLFCPFDRREFPGCTDSLSVNYSLLEIIDSQLSPAGPRVPESDTVLRAKKRAHKYSVLDFGNGYTYVFIGSIYYRYNDALDRADTGYPMKIADAWLGIWADGFDTCFRANPDVVYFFRDTQYIRYNIAKDRAELGYPKEIKVGWPSLPFASVDAVVRHQNGRAYFFSGGEYCRYDLEKDQVDPGYPLPIGPWWKGVWPTGVDSVSRWTPIPTKLYFFKGNEYVRFDQNGDAIDAGYPVCVSKAWTGIPDIQW